MMPRSFLAIACLLGAPSLFAQDKPPVPAFDVASIKPCDETAQVGTMMQETYRSQPAAASQTPQSMGRAFFVRVANPPGRQTLTARPSFQPEH
jgi:hypothetical protein